jgi:hypothetical protein
MIKSYQKHYTVSVRVDKIKFWLVIATIICAILLTATLLITSWLNSSRVIEGHNSLEVEAQTRVASPDEYSEAVNRRLEVVDTTGASPQLISYIEKYAAEYGVSVRYLVCIAKNESGFNPEAVGDSGRAVGVAQWHLGSWQFMREKMGLSTDDLRTCPEESIRTMAFAIANGYSHWWSVSDECEYWNF